MALSRVQEAQLTFTLIQALSVHGIALLDHETSGPEMDLLRGKLKNVLASYSGDIL